MSRRGFTTSDSSSSPLLLAPISALSQTYPLISTPMMNVNPMLDNHTSHSHCLTYPSFGLQSSLQSVQNVFFYHETWLIPHLKAQICFTMKMAYLFSGHSRVLSSSVRGSSRANCMEKQLREIAHHSVICSTLNLLRGLGSRTPTSTQIPLISS